MERSAWEKDLKQSHSEHMGEKATAKYYQH